MQNGFYRFAENFMKIVGVIFTTLIFVSAFLLTAYNYDMTGHHFDLKWDNVLATLVAFAVVLAIGFLIYCWIKGQCDKRIKIFLIVVMAWYLIACEYFAFFGRSMPNSDSWIVYAMAKSMAHGDLSIIHPTASYMSYYPQQIGICAFLSVLIRFIDLFKIGVEEFHFLIAGYGLLETFTVFFLYKTVDNLWNNHKIDFIFLYLSLFNLPYIMYSSYLYGEVPALFFFSVGSAFLSALFAEKGRPIINIIISVLGLALAVWVRKNSLILVIGILIVLFFEFIKEKKIRYIMTAVLIAVCSFFILPLTVKYYENKAGMTLSSGVTPLSYVAMGMQDIGENNNAGWYTGFNFNTYEQSEYDTKVANEKSLEEIKRRLEVFKENPSYAFSFYREKFLTQWVDGTYFSRESTHNYYGERSIFLMRVYYGDYGEKYILICNIYQSLIFLGALLWAAFAFKRGNSGKLWKSMIFVGIFGGFLFHMVWEANSRYIITYASLLVCYAAAGFGGVDVGLKRVKRDKHK